MLDVPVQKRISIIEDEPHIVLGLTDALEFEGFASSRRGKGKEASSSRGKRSPTRCSST